MRKVQVRQGILAMAVAVVACAWATVASAGAVSVDGSLADWGITVNDGTSSSGQTYNYNGGYTGTIYGNNTIDSSGNVTYGNSFGNNVTGFQKQDGIEGYNAIGTTTGKTEDVSDQAGHGTLVDPNFGGQDYDAEWMGTALVGNTLYIGILSGQRSDNGLTNYSPGDIRLVAKNAGGTVVAEFGIETTGATYVLQSDGFTASVLNSPGSGPCATASNGGITYDINAGQTAGSVFRINSAADWIKDPIGSTGGVTPGANENVQIGCGATNVGSATISQANAGSTHAVIEVALNLSGLGSFAELDIYWGPSCGNDVLDIKWPHDEIPAPGGLVMLGFALAAFGALRRRQRIT